jgi:hypothetical protein
MKPVVLLGPQRLAPTVGDEVRNLGIDGQIAIITAGWQEREDEDQELRQALGRPAINLRLYERWEEVRRRDPEFFELHRSRQDRLRQLQDLYRFRLNSAMAVARDLLERKGPDDLLDPEREAAIAAIRAMDDHHLARVSAEHRQFEREVRPGSRPVIARQRAEIEEQLSRCEAVAIAGGHVAVLLNRLQLFHIGPLTQDKPIIAWSAGAMTLTDAVVLFHDHPPEGAGDAEVLEWGLRRVRQVVLLPHARHRLDLGSRVKVGLMARRFSPSFCVVMDEKDRLTWDGGRAILHASSRRLLADGSVGRGARL